MSHSFLEQSIDDLVDKLDINEKISLLAGKNWWNTSNIDHLEIPSVRMSDGPNGVRGSSRFLSTPMQCIPVRAYSPLTLSVFQTHYYLDGPSAQLRSQRPSTRSSPGKLALSLPRKPRPSLPLSCWPRRATSSETPSAAVLSNRSRRTLTSPAPWPRHT